MTLEPNEKPIANPLIVLREEFDDWAILFNPDSGTAFGLNPTGVYIWKLLDGEHSLDDLFQCLKRDLEDVPDEAPPHIKEFITSLTRRSLVGHRVHGFHGAPIRERQIKEDASAKKMKYEKPVLKVFIAEEAKGEDCYSGSSANPVCSGGNNVDPVCWYGSGAAGGCADGFYYSGGYACSNGGGASGNCAYGNSATGTCDSGAHPGSTCNYGDTPQGPCNNGQQASDVCSWGGSAYGSGCSEGQQAHGTGCSYGNVAYSGCSFGAGPY